MDEENRRASFPRPVGLLGWTAELPFPSNICFYYCALDGLYGEHGLPEGAATLSPFAGETVDTFSLERGSPTVCSANGVSPLGRPARRHPLSRTPLSAMARPSRKARPRCIDRPCLCPGYGAPRKFRLRDGGLFASVSWGRNSVVRKGNRAPIARRCSSRTITLHGASLICTFERAAPS